MKVIFNSVFSTLGAYTCKSINVRKEIHLTIHHSPGLIIYHLFVNHILRTTKKNASISKKQEWYPNHMQNYFLT